MTRGLIIGYSTPRSEGQVLQEAVRLREKGQRREYVKYLSPRRYNTLKVLHYERSGHKHRLLSPGVEIDEAIAESR